MNFLCSGADQQGIGGGINFSVRMIQAFVEKVIDVFTQAKFYLPSKSRIILIGIVRIVGPNTEH